MVAASKSRDATVTTAGAAAAVPLGAATAGTRPATTTASTVPTTRRVLGCRMFRPFANVTSMCAHVNVTGSVSATFSKTFSMTSYSVRWRPQQSTLYRGTFGHPKPASKGCPGGRRQRDGGVLEALTWAVAPIAVAGRRRAGRPNLARPRGVGQVVQIGRPVPPAGLEPALDRV